MLTLEQRATKYQHLTVAYKIIKQPGIQVYPLGKKPIVHQLTTMLSTSENVLFPRYNHLLTTRADDPSL